MNAVMRPGRMQWMPVTLTTLRERLSRAVRELAEDVLNCPRPTSRPTGAQTPMPRGREDLVRRSSADSAS